MMIWICPKCWGRIDGYDAAELAHLVRLHIIEHEELAKETALRAVGHPAVTGNQYDREFLAAVHIVPW